MMIQEIIVTIIGLAVAATLGYKVYSFFFLKEKSGGACGCSSCHCNVEKKFK
ncbi:FeoB-associated Cys-rich membrane protein [Dysgonomonas sp. HGC4]|uniref:FeoB-associated Cys-rich membrane protein n=2 Tax=Dysgonomonas TaxID=156973 RepID=UPI001F54B715|nr:FeoB-associated Cys-rich membrane protein [Dysgonomonas sp. HGC4]